MSYGPGDTLPDQNVDPPDEDELSDEERQDLRETEGDRRYHEWAESERKTGK